MTGNPNPNCPRCEDRQVLVATGDFTFANRRWRCHRCGGEWHENLRSPDGLVPANRRAKEGAQ